MLLNKHNLAVSQFVSKEESRYTLKAIQVCEEGTIATDGHRLVKVSLPKLASKNHFPSIDGFTISSGTYDFLLSKDAINKIEKAIPKESTIPALSHVAVGEKTDGDTLSLAVTDLDTAQVFKPRKMTGQFPNWKAVIPQSEPIFEIEVDAEYLAEMAKAAAQFTDDKQHHAVRLRFYKKFGAPIVFEAVRENTEQTFLGLLMPLDAGLDDKLARLKGEKKEEEPKKGSEPVPVTEQQPEQVAASA
jgi:DNA polymerase III sliding clamp (beta) subunit (PCNA family)